MEYVHYGSIFPAFLIIFSFIQPSMSDDPTQALINQICRQTSDFNFCANVFKQKLPSPVANAVVLTQIAITQSFESSTTTRIYIQKKEAAEKNPETKNLYEICNAGYGVVMEALEDATKDFAGGNYKNVLTSVSKCQRPINDCGNVFGANIDAGLKEKNRQMGILVTMSLASDRLIGS